MDLPRTPLALCISTLVLGGCNPSELKAYIEGSTEIPAEYDAMVPQAAREDLIDAKVDPYGLSLRYHEGTWSELLAAFGPKLEEEGYVKLSTCPLLDGEEDGSFTYAKLTKKGKADVVIVGLGVLIKSSGHFFLDVQHNETTRTYLSEGCTFADSAAQVCKDPSSGACRFKDPSGASAE